MADTSTQSIAIAAPPDRVAAVICDFARYPEWVSATKEVEVLEEYEDGYPSQVRFVLDAGVVADEYTLSYEYADDISRIEWHLVEPSKMQKAQDGSYDLARQRRRHVHCDLYARGRAGHRHAGHVQAQGREDHHGHGADRAQASGRVARGGEVAAVPTDPVRDEAERLVAAALAAVSVAARVWAARPASARAGCPATRVAAPSRTRPSRPPGRPARPGSPPAARSAASARSAGSSPPCATRARTSPSGSRPGPASWPPA